jgi:adenylate cyclase
VPALATGIFRRLIADVGRELDTTPRALRTAEQWALLAIINGGADGERHRRALDCLAEAIRLAPCWGYVHGLALAVLMGAVSLGLSGHVEPYLAQQAEWAARVEALEPAVSLGRIMLAFARLVRSRDPKSVRADVRAQLQGLPFEPDLLIWAGYIHLFIGEPVAALDCFNRFGRCVKLDAYIPAVRSGAAGALVQLGRFEEAIARADEALRLNPLAPSPHRAKAAACGWLRRAEEAALALEGL